MPPRGGGSGPARGVAGAGGPDRLEADPNGEATVHCGIGDVTELISESLAAPQGQSREPSDEEPSWSESQSRHPDAAPALPGDYLTDDRVPVYMNGSKWMREIAAMQMEQQF